MATDKPRFSLTLDTETFEKLASYKERHGFSTKSRAIQALVAAGLDEFEQAALPPQTEKAPSMSDEAKELLDRFERLDAVDQGRLIGYADCLAAAEKYQSKKVPSAG